MEMVILVVIRHLAVWEKNTILSRTTLQNMYQDKDEAVRNFSAILHSRADTSSPAPVLAVAS